jgi:hypothetical protein
LLGRSSRTKVLLDPLANKASFSKYLLDTLKQQTQYIFSYIQALKIDLKTLMKQEVAKKSLKLEKWLEILFKIRSIARLQADDTDFQYASAFHFYVQKQT